MLFFLKYIDCTEATAKGHTRHATCEHPPRVSCCNHLRTQNTMLATLQKSKRCQGFQVGSVRPRHSADPTRSTLLPGRYWPLILLSVPAIRSTSRKPIVRRTASVRSDLKSCTSGTTVAQQWHNSGTTVAQQWHNW